jgi:hypothetical protein
MTRITNEAVEAGVAAALERNYGGLAADSTTQALMRDDIRVALEAALPHLEGATPAIDREALAQALHGALFPDCRNIHVQYADGELGRTADVVLALLGGVQ